MRTRTNTQFSEIVEQALVIAAINGKQTALAYLEFHGVPKETIARVLSETGGRRQTDIPSPAAIERCR